MHRGPNDVGRQAAVYVIGAVDAMSTAFMSPDRQPTEMSLCLPNNATREQAVDIVVKYLKENPEKRQYSAETSVWTALRAAFPCPAK